MPGWSPAPIDRSKQWSAEVSSDLPGTAAGEGGVVVVGGCVGWSAEDGGEKEDEKEGKNRMRQLLSVQWQY